MFYSYAWLKRINIQQKLQENFLILIVIATTLAVLTVFSSQRFGQEMDTAVGPTPCAVKADGVPHATADFPICQRPMSSSQYQVWYPEASLGDVLFPY